MFPLIILVANIYLVAFPSNIIQLVMNDVCTVVSPSKIILFLHNMIFYPFGRCCTKKASLKNTIGLIYLVENRLF